MDRQDLIVGDFLVCLPGFVGGEDIMTVATEFLDDTFREVFVGIDRGHQSGWLRRMASSIS